MTTFQLVLVGWIGIAGLMVVLWLIQRKTGDAGIVDVGWTAGVGLLAVLYAAAGDGLPARRLLVAVLTGIWSFRLARHVLVDRVLKGDEDGRYLKLREDWGDRFQSRIFFFFQAQAALAVVFSLPALAAMTSTRPRLGLFDLAGAALMAIAIIGEGIADRQLARHRSDPANRGRTCRSGLWRYSRHPNYFFEWLHWWVYPLIAIGSPWWWVALVGPFAMLYFIVFVTGIPPTEARALTSRGDDYREYQRTTSAFFPWFPKKSDRRPDTAEALNS